MSEDVGVEPGDAWELPAQDSKAAVLAITSDTPGAAGKGWTEDEVKGALVMLSGGAEAAIGEQVGARLTMTRDEVEQLAPPLTRIINRYPHLRGMSSASDAVSVALGLGKYGIRVGGEAIETRRQRAADAALNDEAEA